MSKRTTPAPRSAQPPAEAANQALRTELADVEAKMQAALSELFAPFSQMIDARLRALGPLTRAAIVLTAGIGAPDTDELRAKRVSLAAALEMLHLALAVHMAIGSAAGTDTAQFQSLLGSTILAGDYCFSRSAELAVRTGDPIVVEIFSEALKRVSEGNLRRFFGPAEFHFDEDRELFLAGITAAGQLTGASASLQEAQAQLAVNLAGAQTRALQRQALAEAPIFAELTASQLARWQALIAWFPTD